MDTHHATLLLRETHNVVLHNETRSRQGIENSINIAPTKRTDMNTPEINVYVNCCGGMQIRTPVITNIHGKNNTSILRKWIIQIKRKIFLFTFFYNF